MNSELKRKTISARILIGCRPTYVIDPGGVNDIIVKPVTVTCTVESDIPRVEVITDVGKLSVQLLRGLACMRHDEQGVRIDGSHTHKQ